MVLTQKETSLLQDLKSQEQLCVEKYGKYAADCRDQTLSRIFTEIAGQEQQHLDTVNQMLSGTVPASSGGGGAPKQQKQAGEPAYGTLSDDPGKQHDAYLCKDALTFEKHVSHLYDTCIFEFKDASARDALNHIQKEEQHHGKQLYDYMEKNGMYA